MLIDYEKNSVFTKYYIRTLTHRLTESSTNVENVVFDYSDPVANLEISSQQIAIENILVSYRDQKTIEPMKFIALLEETVNFITLGEVVKLRTTKVEVKGSKIPRTEPYLIRNKLYELIDNYNFMISNCKTEMEIYEIIAMFHKNLMYIHPFEDGNGRVGRIILTKQLLDNSLAPCLITKKDKETYCELIENGSYKAFAEFLVELSIRELKVITLLYNDLKNRGLIDDSLKFS